MGRLFAAGVMIASAMILSSSALAGNYNIDLEREFTEFAAVITGYHVQWQSKEEFINAEQNQEEIGREVIKKAIEDHFRNNTLVDDNWRLVCDVVIRLSHRRYNLHHQPDSKIEKNLSVFIEEVKLSLGIEPERKEERRTGSWICPIL